MKKTAVHQFHSGSAYGDAVTNSMRLIRSLLLAFGFESNIYVERVVRHKVRLLYRVLRVCKGSYLRLKVISNISITYNSELHKQTPIELHELHIFG